MKPNFTKFVFGLFLPLAAYGQTIVSTEPQNKKVILEEFTGIHCQFCPSGHEIAEEILQNNPGNAFAINIHVGSFSTPGNGEPDFRTPFGSAIVGQTGMGMPSTGYPGATANRHVFPGKGMGGNAGITLMDRGNWNSATNEILPMPSYLNMAVEASIDIDTRELIVHVESYYTGNSPVANNFLNVALLQNNTTGPQTGGNMGNNYVHMRRLVHFLTGQWGEEITTTTAGTFVDRTYTYSIPEDYNNVPAILSNMEIVVFMTETHQEIISGNGAFPALIGLEHANDASIKSIQDIPKSCYGNTSPVVEIENLGGNPVTSLTFEYTVNSGTPATYTWTGSIAPLNRQTIELPEIVYNQQANNTLDVSIQEDENNSNNEMALEFMSAVPTESSMLSLEIHTDGQGAQTRWIIRNSANQSVATGFGYENNQTYVEEIELTADDCYTLNFIDVGNNGGATFTLKDQNNVVLIESDGDYGSGDASFFEDFSKGALGIDDQSLADLNIYPNPTKGIVNISSKSSNSDIQVFDTAGRKVYSTKSDKQVTTIDLSSYGKGIYLVKISDGKKTVTKKVIVK